MAKASEFRLQAPKVFAFILKSLFTVSPQPVPTVPLKLTVRRKWVFQKLSCKWNSWRSVKSLCFYSQKRYVSFLESGFRHYYIFSLLTRKQFEFVLAFYQQNNFVLELPPNFLRFKSTTFSIVVTNPLRFEYWYLWTQSNQFEASTDSTKRPISLPTMIASKLNEYVSQGLESYMSGRSKESLTRTLGQASQ